MCCVCISVIWIKCGRLYVFRVLNAIRAESGHATPCQSNEIYKQKLWAHEKYTQQRVCVMGQIKTWHVNNLSSRYAVLPLPLCNVIVCGFCGDKSPRKYTIYAHWASERAVEKCTRRELTHGRARMPVYHTSTHTRTRAAYEKNGIHRAWNFNGNANFAICSVSLAFNIKRISLCALIRPPIFLFVCFFFSL